MAGKKVTRQKLPGNAEQSNFIVGINFIRACSLGERARYEYPLHQITYYAMISDDSLMLTAIFKIGVRMHYIAETMFNNNNLPRTCATLSLSLSLLCSLPRFANAYCTLSVQRTFVSAKRYAFFIVFYDVTSCLYAIGRYLPELSIYIRS